MENLDINETVEIDNTQPKKKRWYLPTKVIFVAIVILGMLGMVCFLFAIIMFDIDMYNSSLDESKSNFYFKHYLDWDIYDIDYLFNNENVDIEKFFENSNLVGITRLDSNNNVIQTYGTTDNTVPYRLIRYIYSEDAICYFDMHILKDAPYEGDFHFANKFVEFIYNNKNNIWAVGVLVGSFILILYVDLIKSTDDKRWAISFIPVEINFIATMILGAFVCYISASAFFRAYYPDYLEHYLYYIIHLFTIGVATALFLTLTIDITKRVKAKTVLETSIVGVGFSASFKLSKKIFENINVLWKYLLIYFVVALIGLFHMIKYYYSTLFIFVVMNIIIFPIFAYFILNFVQIIKASEKIASGDYDYKVDAKYMYLGFDNLANNLNNISAGMEVALAEKLKSELLKTELITNVSHDIKTPLTSIINYSDLICKEEDNEKITEYSQVLHRQSNKLKKLIDDLLEVSKASSGNVIVNLEPIKLDVFLEQVTGEYNEKLAQNKLELITDITPQDSEHLSVLADGKLLSRVFDNLFNNIVKYSLEGTRVYFDVKISQEFANITLKNTSKYQLNISQELLTERFIRGDASRHSDGSGLGLSIAQNLVKTQGGEFDINIDGDLFKVMVKLRLSDED